jgi:hypothetical protein
MSNTVFDVKQFGAKGDGTTDDYTAFKKALDAMAALSNANNPRGAVLWIPFGKYRLTKTLHVTRQMVIQGESGSGWYSGSVLFFADDIDGIVIHRPSTVPARIGIAPGRGDWTVIRDLGITGRATYSLKSAKVPPFNEDDPLTAANQWATRTGHPPLAGSGVVLYARAMIENCLISGFKYDGVHVETTDYSDNFDPSPKGSRVEKNANNFEVRNCRIELNGRHGIFTAGDNANAGRIVGVDCSNNASWGIYDRSFLGNTYVGCHVSDNGHFATTITAVAFDPNDEAVWAGAPDGGAFRSPDRGATWSAPNAGLYVWGREDLPEVSSLAVQPFRGATGFYSVYAGTLQNGVYQSHWPRTENWARWNDGLPDLRVHALVFHKKMLFAATDTGVFKSPPDPKQEGRDSSWTPTGVLKTPAARALCSKDDALFVGTDGGGVFKSTNGGATWIEINVGLTSLQVRALAAGPGALYAGTKDGVFVIHDGETSWTMGTGIPSKAQDVRAVAVTASTPDVAYAGTESSGVFKSIDQGLTWSITGNVLRLTDGPPPKDGIVNPKIRALAVDPQHNWIVYAGADGGGNFGPVFNPGGLIKSVDAGANWRLMDTFYGGPYKTTGPLANNVLVGCYSESNPPNGSELVYPTLVLGGTLAGGIHGFNPITTAQILDKYGLERVDLKGSVIYRSRTIVRPTEELGQSIAPTSSYQIILTAEDRVLTIDATNGHALVLLPYASSVNGYQFTVKRLDSAPSNFLVQIKAAAPGGPIDGVGSYVMNHSGEMIAVVAEEGGYKIVARTVVEKSVRDVKGDKGPDVIVLPGERIICADGSWGKLRVLLPDPTGLIGAEFTVKRVDSVGNTNAVTVEVVGGLRIDAGTSVALTNFAAVTCLAYVRSYRILSRV